MTPEPTLRSLSAGPEHSAGTSGGGKCVTDVSGRSGDLSWTTRHWHILAVASRRLILPLASRWKWQRPTRPASYACWAVAAAAALTGRAGRPGVTGR
jgi:hypothetical protein